MKDSDSDDMLPPLEDANEGVDLGKSEVDSDHEPIQAEE